MIANGLLRTRSESVVLYEQPGLAREILSRAMLEENVERSRQVMAAFNQRDIDAFLEYFDPEVEFFALITRMEGGDPYRGYVGMRQWWDTITGIFPTFSVDILDTRAHGDATVAQFRLRGRGTESGAPIDQKAWSVMKWRNRKTTWWGVFRSEGEALKAAGLPL